MLITRTETISPDDTLLNSGSARHTAGTIGGGEIHLFHPLRCREKSVNLNESSGNWPKTRVKMQGGGPAASPFSRERKKFLKRVLTRGRDLLE